MRFFYLIFIVRWEVGFIFFMEYLGITRFEVLVSMGLGFEFFCVFLELCFSFFVVFRCFWSCFGV